MSSTNFLSHEEQINGLLSMSLFDVLREKGIEPFEADWGAVLTVSVKELADALRESPESLARARDLARQSCGSHDCARFVERLDGYDVQWMGAGLPGDTQHWPDEASALAALILVLHGVWRDK
jgi:hypothetical protein